MSDDALPDDPVSRFGGESTGFGFGFTYLFKYAEGGGWHWGEHLAESRWVTLHNPHSHLSDSL